MDFSCFLRQEPIPNPSREFKGFDEDENDDEHFAELRRRILLLMADDEEENERFVRPKCSGPVNPHKESFNSFSRPVSRPAFGFNRVKNMGNVSFPTVRPNLNAPIGSGTGVFIPLATLRRRADSGRSKNQKRNMSRRKDN